MKKFVSLLIASAAMVATAYAGEMAGVVKTYDEATKTVTLEDGTAYVLSEGVVADGIVAGAKVKVTFDDASKAATAVAIEK
jgi:F420-0:gamma-glutamyl ligase-like protein